MNRCSSYSNLQIKNRFEKLYSFYKEEYKKIINFNKVKKGEFNVNLIHYDKNKK